MSNLFEFTDPCEPMCDMCTPLEMTPIYVQLKAEYEERGRYARGGWIKQDTTKIRVRPEFITLDECGPVSRKPLLKNGKRR